MNTRVSCKTADEVFALPGGRRKLTEDELEQIVGGSIRKGPTSRTLCWNDELMTYIEFNEYWILVQRNAKTMSGFGCGENE